MNTPLIVATLIALAFGCAAAFGDEPGAETVRGSMLSSAPVALASIGAALGAAGLLRVMGRRASRAREEAHEIAFYRLKVARGLMEPGSSRHFAGVIATALREYIEARFDVNPGGTTNQLTIALLRSESAAQREWAVILKDIFDHCDFVQISGRNLSGGQLDLMHLRAWQFVDRTRYAAGRPEEIERRAA